MVRRRHLLKGAAVSLGVFLVFGAVADLIRNPIWIRMVPRTPLDYTFLVATSLLAGVYIVQREQLQQVPGDACAYGGAIGGFLAFGCPVCNHILLALLGASATMTYFDPLRPILGAVSVAVFAGVIYYRHRQHASARNPPSDADDESTGTAAGEATAESS